MKNSDPQSQKYDSKIPGSFTGGTIPPKPRIKMIDPQQDSKMAAAKVAASVGGAGTAKFLSIIGVSTWADFSGLMASLVSLLFIIDWVWKKVKAWRAGKRERKTSN